MATMSITMVRTRIRDAVEQVYEAARAWLAKHPLVIKVYYAFSWLSLIFLLISLIFVRDSRLMMVQYLWSFYVLLQFWLLCRSKTLPWKHVSLLVLSGVILVVPLTNLTIQLLHLIFGGRTSDTWSMAVATPIVEEALKLLPLAAFLFFSRRASALSLSDYVLLGAAPGVGFQLIEELSRRWVNDGYLARQYDYSVTLLGGKTIHWDLFTLFPGYFEESIVPLMMSEGHPLHTAVISLGVGFAVRFRRKLTPWVYLFPVILLLWAILNHVAWNGQSRLPDWIMTVHEWTGEGYRVKDMFLLMLAGGLIMDYVDLNKVRQRLPRYGQESMLNPFSELFHTLTALFSSRKRFGNLLAFYRARRELGFSFLYGNEEAKSRELTVHEHLQKYGVLLGALAVLLLAAGVFSGFQMVQTPDSACFACLFDSLQSWWDRLSGWEQAAIVLGAFALGFMFVGFWPALGLALTGLDIASSGHSIASYIRDPKKLLSPQHVLAGLTAFLLDRIPVGRGLRWLSDRLGPRAKGLLDAIQSKLGLKPKPDGDTPGMPDRHEETPNGKPEPENRQPDDKPEDTKPGQNKPNDKPEDNRPDENKPDENKPDVNKPDENKSGENHPPENKPEESGLTEPTTSGGEPRGNYETPDPNDPRPIMRQNETADLLASQGYDVEMLPGTKGGNGHGILPESNPDFLINGKAFDCYSPDTGNVRNIWSTIVGKTERQAGGIVLNLDDYTGSMDKLMKQFDDWPIEGLDELFVVKDGTITRWFPK
ncbi:hypothetical protein BBD40_29005 [Paenibacillus ihbetae]|uniref:tRNA nuclease CdiA C-terminal domain-containing protein n=2 Tax=Paenibacillus ihbetae TaxID=1870820 RepID=A0ABX3JNI7_9BACL|nr:hypothetical protein BBD40_29005 [Paenibacillus ihbetae]